MRCPGCAACPDAVCVRPGMQTAPPPRRRPGMGAHLNTPKSMTCPACRRNVLITADDRLRRHRVPDGDYCELSTLDRLSAIQAALLGGLDVEEGVSCPSNGVT